MSGIHAEFASLTRIRATRVSPVSMILHSINLRIVRHMFHSIRRYNRKSRCQLRCKCLCASSARIIMLTSVMRYVPSGKGGMAQSKAEIPGLLVPTIFEKFDENNRKPKTLGQLEFFPRMWDASQRALLGLFKTIPKEVGFHYETLLQHARIRRREPNSRFNL